MFDVDRRDGLVTSQARPMSIVGQSDVIRELSAEIQRVARSEAKVLITGESGVGKELVAGAIHYSSPRGRNPFVNVNCAGLTETLLESELFGHMKGSFTGAFRDKAGKLELADRGTVFLDEVGEMTLRMQGLLLRFTQNGELQKVGTDRSSTRVNVRIIAATNRDLRDLIHRGLFRDDLYHRLNVIHLAVPPLRDRASDIPLLIEYFLDRLRATAPVTVRSLTPQATDALVAYRWPGNVRELENVIERLAVHCQAEVADLADLPHEIRSGRDLMGAPRRERRRSVSDDLYRRMVHDQQSFWQIVYPLYMQREITKGQVRDLVRRGLEEARGNYKIVARLFNMEPDDYKRFLKFLRKHDCQLPFQDYRQ